MSATGRVASTGIPSPVARRPAASATRRASPASRRASTASRRGETSDATRTGSRSSSDGHVARGTAPYANLDLVRETELSKKERTAMHTFHTQGGRQVHVECIPIGEEYLLKFEVAEDVVYDLRGEPVTDDCGELFLHWGLHREWLDEWMALPDLPPDSAFNDDDPSRPATRTPLVRDGDRSTVVFRRGFPLRFARARFEIPSYFVPLELNFVVVEVKPDGKVVYDGPKRPPGSDVGRPGASFAVPVGMAPGSPEPLGASRALSLGPASGPGWVNFALHSAFASKVTLFLQWTHGDGDAPETMEIALNPTTHKTGDVWHVALPVGSRGAMLPSPAAASVPRVGAADASAGLGHAPAVLYGFKVDGDATRGGWRFHPRQVMLDPRAECLVPPLGDFPDPDTPRPPFLGSLADVMNGGGAQLAADALADRAPRARRIPAQEFVYELSVADFTGHVSSGLAPGEAGTYAGVAAKVDHIVATGATTVLLHPMQYSPRRTTDDAWGFAPVSLHAPDPALCSPDRGAATHQIREMVRALRARGLEVLVHMVVTHLGEGSDDAPRSHSIRGVDVFSYYQMGPTGRLEENPAVPGTTALNPTSVVTQRLILDALRRWRTVVGVDGFVLDTGGGVARGAMGRSTLLESAAQDPVLGGGKGAGGAARAAGVQGGGVRLYLTPGEPEVGRMQNWGVIGERTTPAYAREVTRFLEGAPGSIGGFAVRVCGSADLIRGERSSAFGHVLNSLTAPPHGKTLCDLAGLTAMRAKVEKTAAPELVPAGPRPAGGAITEGRAPEKKLPPLPPTPGETALMLRAMIATLFLSDGVPVLSAGDEYGHTRGGHDGAPWTFKNEANAFRWDAVAEGAPGARLRDFTAACAAFRRRRADLFASGGSNVGWFALDGASAPAWDDPAAPTALMCRRRATPPPGATSTPDAVTQDVVVAWNATGKLASASIGQPPIGYAWVRVLDTALASPQDCALSYVNLAGPNGTYLVAPHAVLVLELAPAPVGMEPTVEQVAAAKRRAARIPDAARAAPEEGATAGDAAAAARRAEYRPAVESRPARAQPARPNMPARPKMPSKPSFRPPQ